MWIHNWKCLVYLPSCDLPQKNLLRNCQVYIWDLGLWKRDISETNYSRKYFKTTFLRTEFSALCSWKTRKVLRAVGSFEAYGIRCYWLPLVPDSPLVYCNAQQHIYIFFKKHWINVWKLKAIQRFKNTVTFCYIFFILHKGFCCCGSCLFGLFFYKLLTAIINTYFSPTQHEQM